MKNLLRNSIIVFSVVVLTINLVDSIVAGAWNDFSLYLEIGVLSVVICIIKYILDNFQSRYYILNIIIQFTITLALVLLFGYVLHWYSPQGIWLICVTVAVAYALSFILGVLKVNRDVALINEKLKAKKSIAQAAAQNQKENLL
ncbi:DUF3021 family protein [Oscillospiraceae bacterium PP1C4]